MRFSDDPKGQLAENKHPSKKLSIWNRAMNKSKRKPTDHGSPRPCKKSKKSKNTDDDNNKNKNNKEGEPLVNDNKDNKEKTQYPESVETVVASSNLVPRAERAECSICHEVMSSSTCVSALLVCGHASTCVSCYEKWNKGKRIKICPICKHTQTASPIQVSFYPKAAMDAPLPFATSIRVNYVGGFTRTGMDANSTPNLTIGSLSNSYTPDLIINMSTTGDEIKKIALQKFSDIQFPNDYLSLFFRIEDQSFPFHGNTTLGDIGFKQDTHYLYIQEEYLPFEHELVQQRLELLEKSPDGKFKIFLKPARGLKLKTCRLIVEKHYTIGSIAEFFLRCLENVPNHECFIGKKFDLDLVNLGVEINTELTLEKLRVNTKTIIYYNLID